jgi:uncharacterized repeat protein (TIGR03803 family)
VRAAARNAAFSIADADGRGVPARKLSIGNPMALVAILVSMTVVAAAIIFLVPEDRSGNFRVIRQFGGWDGAGPSAAPALLGGSLYGAACGGGQRGAGTIFAVGSQGEGFALLRSFDQANGTAPVQGPVPSLDGKVLYGITPQGGAFGGGAAYRICANGTGYQVIASFGGVNGSVPLGQAALSADGAILFCALSQSGQFGRGTIAAVGLQGGSVAALHHFSGADGAFPIGGLLLDSSGTTLYGTASAGGTGDGTVFRIGTDGAGFEVLHAFTGYDGAMPSAGLCADGHGLLLGTTAMGGLSGGGTVFSIDANGSFALLHSFSTEGSAPSAALAYSNSTHFFYGTAAQGGKAAQGSLFRIAGDGTGFAVLFDFGGVFGGTPGGICIDQGSAVIFGTAGGEGANGVGVLWSYTLSGGH